MRVGSVGIAHWGELWGWDACDLSEPRDQAGADATPLPSLTSQGRPKNGPEDKFRLTPVAPRLQQLLGKPVSRGTTALDRCSFGVLRSGGRAKSRARRQSAFALPPALRPEPPSACPPRRLQVKKLNDCIGDEVTKAVADAKNGEVGDGMDMMDGYP